MPNIAQTCWEMRLDVHNPLRLNMYISGPIYSNRQSFPLGNKQQQTVASEFVAELERYPKVNEIHLYINSPGGHVFAALEMANRLLSHPARKITYNDGMAASAATLLFAVGEERYAKPGAVFMYHNASAKTEGNAKQLAEGIKYLNTITEGVIDIYEASSNLSRETIQQLMDAETFLSAREAIEHGFATHYWCEPRSQIKKDKQKSSMLVMIDETMRTIMSNGQCFSLNMFDNVENFKTTLLNIKTQIDGVSQEGEQVMNYEEFKSGLTEEQNTFLKGYLESYLAEKTAAYASELTAVQTEVTALKAQIASTTSSTESVTATAGIAEAALLAQELTVNMSPEMASKVNTLMDIMQSEAQQLQAEREAREFMTFKQTLANFKNLPIDESTTASLFALAKAGSEHYQRVTELLKVADCAMATQMEAVGSAKTNSTTSAYDQLDKQAKEKMTENGSLAYDKAINLVAAEQPELWSAYLNEIM